MKPAPFHDHAPARRSRETGAGRRGSPPRTAARGPAAGLAEAACAPWTSRWRAPRDLVDTAMERRSSPAWRWKTESFASAPARAPTPCTSTSSCKRSAGNFSAKSPAHCAPAHSARGTFCGSVADADPASERCLVATAPDAETVACSTRGPAYHLGAGVFRRHHDDGAARGRIVDRRAAAAAGARCMFRLPPVQPPCRRFSPSPRRRSTYRLKNRSSWSRVSRSAALNSTAASAEVERLLDRPRADDGNLRGRGGGRHEIDSTRR